MKKIFAFALLTLASVAYAGNTFTIEDLLNRSGTHLLPADIKTEPEVNAYMLVSFSMPKTSLDRLAQDAKDAGIPLVFTGVPKEEIETGKALLNPRSLAPFSSLIEKGVAVELNPELFSEYGVKQVPLLLLQEATPSVNSDGCQNTPRAVGVPGDVTLGYALDRLTDRNDAIGEKARELRARLGGRA